MKRFVKLVAFITVVAFSNLIAVTAVAQIASVPKPAAVAKKTEKGEPIRTDDIVVPMRPTMPKAITVEKGGVGVVAPVNVTVNVPEALPPIIVNVPPAPTPVVVIQPPKKTPIYKEWWFWTLITAAAAGAVVGGVCGSGHCGTTTNVHIGR